MFLCACAGRPPCFLSLLHFLSTHMQRRLAGLNFTTSPSLMVERDAGGGVTSTTWQPTIQYLSFIYLLPSGRLGIAKGNSGREVVLREIKEQNKVRDMGTRRAAGEVKYLLEPRKRECSNSASAIGMPGDTRRRHLPAIVSNTKDFPLTHTHTHSNRASETRGFD